MSERIQDIGFDFPRVWSELTPKEYEMVLRQNARRSASDAAARLVMLRAGLRVMHRWGDSSYMVRRGGEDFVLTPEQIAAVIETEGRWLLEPPTEPLRPSVMHGREAHDARLADTDFGTWLAADNFMMQATLSGNEGWIDRAFDLLYKPRKPRRWLRRREQPLEEWERLAVIWWIGGLHALFAREFPDLYPKGNGDGVRDRARMTEAARKQSNVLLRALTKGDTTKEEAVLEVNVWRALTELNELARQSAEFEAKYGKKG